MPGAGMVYGGHRRIDANGNPIGPEKYDPIGPDPYLTLLTCNPIGMHGPLRMVKTSLSLVASDRDACRRAPPGWMSPT